MQKKLLLVLAIILVILTVLYVSISAKKNRTQVPNPTPYATVTPVAPSASPLSFDQLLNASVQPEWNEDGAMITLKNGAYESGENSVDLVKTPGSYTPTDLDGDGAGDMLAVIASNSGGTGYFYELIAFLNVNETPKYAGKLFLGDRITVNKISAQGNIVTVDIITQGPGEPLCCGTMKQVKKYSFDLAEGFKEI